LRPLKGVDFRKMAAVSSLALILPSSIVVGLIIGYFLDRWLKTAPWMLLVWTILGVISGITSLFRGIKRYLLENQEETDKAGNRSGSDVS